MKNHKSKHAQLACLKCDFIASRSDELKQHYLEWHRQSANETEPNKSDSLKCSKCDFKAGNPGDLNVHSQSNHMSMQVNIDINDQNIIACQQCEYKCNLNIKLKKHMKTMHKSDKKYTCEECDFGTAFVANVWEHTLTQHPNKSYRFNEINKEDMILKIVAEQNEKILAEIENLKKDTKVAFGQFAIAIDSSLSRIKEEASQECTNLVETVENLNEKILNLQATKSNPPSPKASTAPLPGAHPGTSSISPPASAPAAQRSTRFKKKKKKTSYMEKPRVLYIGDSVGHNANFASLEISTESRIKTAKAYSSVEDQKARWPRKNFSDVTPAVINTFKEDAYTHLVLSAPTVDISNMNTANLTAEDNIEVFKHKVIASCHNMISVAENACKSHPELTKVVIMDHAPRYDTHDVDPTGLKPKLATFANATLAQMWHSSDMKDRIHIGKHNLDCTDDQIEVRYRSEQTARYDGVHLYGSQGRISYTNSVLQILKSVLPPPLRKTAFTPSSSTSNQTWSTSDHSSCPQAMFQKKKKTMFTPNQYSVPVRNHFEILGN